MNLTYELVTVESKKKQYAQKYDRKSSKFLIALEYKKAFSVAMWLLPILEILFMLISHLVNGTKIEQYEYISTALICCMFLVCFGFGKWLISKVAQKASTDTVYQRKNEKIDIILPNTLEYCFCESNVQKQIKLMIQDVSINEKLRIVEINGLDSNNSNITLSLHDYYEPGLIETIKIIRRELL